MATRVLLQINAGKCLREGRSVVPQLEKGRIVLELQEDGLLHFLWTGRDEHVGTPSMDFVLFSGDAVFSKVVQSPDRVYSLKFETSGERHLFWLQDADRGRDASLASSVMSLIESGGDGELETAKVEDSESAAAVCESESAGSRPTPNFTPDQLSQLSQILQSMPQDSSLSASAQRSDIDLVSLFSKDVLYELLKDPSVVRELGEYLPEEVAKTPEEALRVLTSPQCHQCVDAIVYALHSGQLGGLLLQFGLDPDIFTVKDLLEAIRAGQKK